MPGKLKTVDNLLRLELTESENNCFSFFTACSTVNKFCTKFTKKQCTTVNDFPVYAINTAKPAGILTERKDNKTPAVLITGYTIYYGRKAVKNCLILDNVARHVWGLKQIETEQRKISYPFFLRFINRYNIRNNSGLKN